MSKKLKTGLVSKQADYKLEIKYAEDKQNHIRITPKKGVKSIELNVDDLVNMIADNFANKPLALALTDAQMSNIFMVEAERPAYVHFAKDYKAGETIQFTYRHMYPYVLAALEKAYSIATAEGKVTAIEKSEFEETLNKLMELNRPFVETFRKQEIDIANSHSDTEVEDTQVEDTATTPAEPTESN